jgi:hypothetical protein
MLLLAHALRSRCESLTELLLARGAQLNLHDKVSVYKATLKQSSVIAYSC